MNPNLLTAPHRPDEVDIEEQLNSIGDLSGYRQRLLEEFEKRPTFCCLVRQIMMVAGHLYPSPNPRKLYLGLMKHEGIELTSEAQKSALIDEAMEIEQEARTARTYDDERNVQAVEATLRDIMDRVSKP